MAFCGKCGTKIEDGAKFCPACGAEAQIPGENAQPQGDYGAKLQSLNNTADETAQFDAGDIQQNKVMAILAYIGILVLIPLFAARAVVLPGITPTRVLCFASRKSRTASFTVF